MICAHGMMRWRCSECRTDADRDIANRERVDVAAATFRKERGRYDAVGIDAFSRSEADKMLAYAENEHSDVPFFIRSLAVDAVAAENMQNARVQRGRS